MRLVALCGGRLMRHGRICPPGSRRRHAGRRIPARASRYGCRRAARRRTSPGPTNSAPMMHDEPHGARNRDRARRQHGAAVEQQPGPGKQSLHAGVPEHGGEHRAGEQGGAQTQQELAHRTEIARVPGLGGLARHEGAAHENAGPAGAHPDAQPVRAQCGSEAAIAASRPMTPITTPAVPGTAIEVDASMERRM